MAVRTANGEQTERFRALREEFAERYAAARRHDAPRLVEPEWQQRNAQLEEALLPRPPLQFLRHPAILYSMFLGERYAAAELEEIERLVPPQDRRALLEEDAVGAPPLLGAAGGPYATSANLIHHVHHLLRFGAETGTDLADLSRLVEWGGGYGSLARVFARLRGEWDSYAIVDTPLFACLQWLFLASLHGPDRVRLCLEGSVDLLPGGFTIVPVGLWRAVPHDADLFISTWALNESAIEAQDAVAAGGWFGARHLLMGMHDGAGLTAAARRDGARVVPVGEFMPNQAYVLR